MTVTSTNNKNNYVGDDITTVFPYDFFIGTQAELRVDWYNTDGVPTKLAPDEVTGMSYSVAGAGQPTGKEITLLEDDAPRALAVDEALLLRLKPPLMQLVSFAAGGTFEGWRHEYQVYDYIVRCALGQQEELDRCSIDLLDVLVDIAVNNDITLGGDEASDEEMPSQNAVSKYFEIDSSTDLDGVDASDIKVPSQNAAYVYITNIVENQITNDTTKAPSQMALISLSNAYTYRPEGFGQQDSQSFLSPTDIPMGATQSRLSFELPENEFTAAPVFAHIRGLRWSADPAMIEGVYLQSESSAREAVFELFYPQGSISVEYFGITIWHLLVRTTP
jgi:hypothetical protein